MVIIFLHVSASGHPTYLPCFSFQEISEYCRNVYKYKKEFLKWQPNPLKLPMDELNCRLRYPSFNFGKGEFPLLVVLGVQFKL